MSVGFIRKFDKKENSFMFSTSRTSAKTVSDSKCHPCNLTGVYSDDKVFDGNYMQVETTLRNVDEDSASCWNLRFNAAEFAEFEQEFLKLFTNYVNYECKIRYDSIRYGCNYLNPMKSEYVTLNVASTLLANEILVQEVSI